MRNYCYKKGTYSLSPRAGRTAGEGVIAHRREHAVLEKEEQLEEELLLTVKHSLNDVQSPRPLLFTGATVHLQYIYFQPPTYSPSPTFHHFSSTLTVVYCTVYTVQYVHLVHLSTLPLSTPSSHLHTTYYLLLLPTSTQQPCSFSP